MKLHVFDFDGTLFDSPLDTEENKKKYQKVTGIPWVIDNNTSKQLSKKHGRHIGMRRGWWGRPETLEPPLVPDPVPPSWFKKEPREKFLSSTKSKDTVTLLLTGRYLALKKHIVRILEQGNLMNGGFDFLCLGERSSYKDEPVPSETFPWKLYIINQYLKHVPEIDSIEMWEDREEHVVKFKECLKNVTVNHVV